ncbi:MAG: 50S ribosomal protein L25 [Patescibacteria group bacterium]
MISLVAKTREKGNVKALKKTGQVPAVVYGPKEKNLTLQVDEKDFMKIFKQAGESSLIELNVDKLKKPVLIHEIQKDPVSGKIIHIDFYQPDLKKEVEVKIPLVFEGTALAEKDLGGTLVKNILEIEVKALPQDLPHEIKVSIDSLKTFEDHILVKDLHLPEGVKVMKDLSEIVASVLAPQDVEAELAKEIEEKVEDIEKVAKPEKEEEVAEEPKEAPKEEVKKEQKLTK